MPMATPILNLPQPAASSTRTATPAATAAAAATPAPAAKTPDAPSTVVTLSPQALSAAWAASHPSSPASSATTAATLPVSEPAAHDGSVYESLKNGISTAATDVGDAIAEGAHAVADGVETTLSAANRLAKGILELPFATVAKGCDAVGSLIDKL